MNAYWAREAPALERRERERSSHLHKLARCVDLLAEELDALDLGDLPRLRDVAEKRATAEAELRSAARAEEGTPFHAIYTEAVTEALQRVDEWKERERLTRDELTHLRDESLTLVRSIPQGSHGGRYPVLDETGGHLNVRL
ncbi:MAG: tRNA (adenine(58)-N(1))-methyltransferase non-catalytic subunit TRM6 [Gemmatimonadetes bacterium]|nr:tRNA (adenine(58)-N(1))-methyltransferase non-catalytic subunit TRM6 [Gemmatimonadota bacterium]